MNDKDVARLREQGRSDRKLFERAAQVLAEIDRSQGLSDVHADVLAALRIRLEGRRRASLDELLSAAGDISGKKDLADAAIDEPGSEWPAIKEKKRDWPS
ncbi:hypothetical protein BH20ACT21_BH20ACT21_12240 [soil metagenome]